MSNDQFLSDIIKHLETRSKNKKYNLFPEPLKGYILILNGLEEDDFDPNGYLGARIGTETVFIGNSMEEVMLKINEYFLKNTDDCKGKPVNFIEDQLERYDNYRFSKTGLDIDNDHYIEDNCNSIIDSMINRLKTKYDSGFQLVPINLI